MQSNPNMNANSQHDGMEQPRPTDGLKNWHSSPKTRTTMDQGSTNDKAENMKSTKMNPKNAGKAANGKISRTAKPDSTDAATPGAVVNGNGSSFDHDRIPRRRDDRGNRIPFGIAYIPPISGSKDLDETQLRLLLNTIDEAEPVKAAYLRSLYQDRLRPAYLRLQSVRSEVEREFAQLRARSVRLDKEIDPIVANLESSRDDTLAQPVENLSSATQELDDARLDASEKVCVAGGSFDPENPSDDCVVRISRKSQEEAADSLQLPWGPTVRVFRLPNWLVWVLTALCGSVVGVSLAIFANFIDDLFGDVPMLLLWAVLGQGMAIWMRKAIGWAFFCFSESFHLHRPRRQQVSWFVAALTVFGAILLASITVERYGILKLGSFQAMLSGSDELPITPFAMWCMAAVVTLGYFIYSAYDGIVHGRTDAIENAIAAEIERDFAERSEARREQPTVKDALRSLNFVRRAMAMVTSAEAKVAALTEEHAQRIAKEEARRIPYPEELSQEQKYRVQDALDNLVGCQIEFDSVLASVLGVARPAGRMKTRSTPLQDEQPKPQGLWDRIRRAVRPR